MKRIVLFLLIAACLLLASCGSNGPSCQGPHFHMSCVKGQPNHSRVAGRFGGASQVYGVDTYGGGPASLPVAYDCAYLSGYPGGKDWTRAGIQSWLAHGKSVCFVWETYATRAEYGYGSGQQDAIRARSEAASLGVPIYVPIRFAVDTDTSANDVMSYFEGVKSVLGSRTGVYGSYQVVNGLEARGITTPRNDWQTVAWSGNNRGRACLYQSGINQHLNGVSIDPDWSSCADFGQYPYAQKPVIVCFGSKAQGNATCRKVHAEIAAWQKSAAASQRVYDKRGCPVLTKRRNVLNRRWDWFWSALRDHPHVKRAHREAALASTGRAVDNVRKVITGRSCLTFSSRVAYFNARIATVRRQYS